MKISEYTNEEINIIEGFRTEVRKNQQQCYAPDCKEKSIRSHVLQRGGPLAQLAVDNKVLVLQRTKLYEKSGYSFDTHYINEKKDVLTFWGFCEKCDREIFKAIETPICDYNIYKNQLLTHYRTLANELYKKQYNIKYFELVAANNKIRNEIRETYQNLILQEKIGAAFLLYEKELCEIDIEKSTQSFKFITLKLPVLDVCASIAFGNYSIIKDSKDLRDKIKEGTSMKAPGYNYSLTLIPEKASSYCVLGTSSDLRTEGHFIHLDRILKQSIPDNLKLISNIIIKMGETWCMSLRLCQSKRQKQRIKQCLAEINRYAPPQKKHLGIKFNLFGDLK